MSKDKQSICVTVRVRPLSNKQLQEDSRTCLRVDETLNMISIINPLPQKEAKDFYFDSVCDANQQSQIFQLVGKRSTMYCMEGYNCTIFAYGQTGAGKTFTMMGVNPESKYYFQQRGLIPRTLQYLFDCIEKQISDAGVDYIIRCSFVEIYNQQIIDLLGTGNNSLNIRQDLKKGVYIEGVNEQIISQSQQAMQILRKGSKGRHVGSTFYNETSSRSHSVFTMQIQSQKLCNGIKSTKSRHFHFIDLAGSERTKKSMGDRLKQGCSINKSLHVLSMVISSLAQVSQGKTRHVNYRDSKLTFLLKDSLGGNSKTHLIANVSPSFMSCLQTKSTLMFARKVKLIKVNKVSINQDASGNLQSLKAEIKRLRSQNLLLKNGNIQIQMMSTEQNAENIVNGANNKMVNVLQQYVDEQLQKQTQMQIWITKLQNKNNHLEKGIKHFIQNQKQLRMVISIYEDKISKLKKIQSSLYQKLEQISNGEMIQQIKSYFLSQRQILIDQIEKFKQLSSSSTLVKNLLKELKVLKQNPDNFKQQQALIKIIAKNNVFLQQIKQAITDLEPEVQQGKASKALVKQNQSLKTQNMIFKEKLQKYTLQLAETKDKTQQTQTLLNEAIFNQISLEKKLQQQQNNYNMQLGDYNKIVTVLRQQLFLKQEQIRSFISKQNQLKINISKSDLLISELKDEVICLKEKRQFEQLNFQQKLQALTTENTKIQEILKKKTQEIKKLKSNSFQFKLQSERINKQTQLILADAASRIEELEGISLKTQNQKNQLKEKVQIQRVEYQKKIDSFIQEKELTLSKMKDLRLQIENYHEQVVQKGEQISFLKQKFEQAERTHTLERQKWQQNNNQLIKMINEKKASDSQTQTKLKQSQFEIISLSQKLSELTIQYKTINENYFNLEQISQAKIGDLQRKNHDKQILTEKLIQQIRQLQNKALILHSSEISLKKQQKILQDQIISKQLQQARLIQELQKQKKKQKQARDMISQTKNQMFAVKKNYEIQLSSLTQLIKFKQDQLAAMVKQNMNIKQIHERYLAEYQTKALSQLQILKENEVSIKKAMQAHLQDKQKKIIQIEMIKQNLQIDLQQKNLLLAELKQQQKNKSNQVLALENQVKESELQKNKLKDSFTKLQSQMSQLEEEHLKAVQEMQNNFNDEIDSKNAQIVKLRKNIQEKESILQRLEGINNQNNQLKSQLNNVNAFCNQLQKIKTRLLKQLQQMQNNGQISNNYVIQIQQKLKQKQIYLNQLNQNIKQSNQNFTLQFKEKQEQNKKLNAIIESLRKQIQNLNNQNNQLAKQQQHQQQNIQQLDNILQNQRIERDNLIGIINNLEKAKICMNDHIIIRQRQNYLIIQQKIEMQGIIGKLVQNQRQFYGFLSQFMSPQELNSGMQINFIAKTSQLLGELQNKNKNLQAELYQAIYHNQNLLQENQRLIQIIKNLQNQIHIRYIESSQHIENISKQLYEASQRNISMADEFRQVSEINIKFQKQLNQLTISLDRKQKQQQNLEQNLHIIKNKAEQQEKFLNECLAKTHQQSSMEVRRLSELYEISNQKIESLKNQNEKTVENQNQLKKLYENKINVLENQIKIKNEDLNKYNDQLSAERQKNQQMRNFIDQQNYKINSLQQQKERLNQQIQQIKNDSQKTLKESQKRCHMGAAQVNSLREQLKLIQEEASVWKQRMENLQNQIRLSNERSQKFRFQYTKQKQLNKQFKMLLDNAHCQIQTFKTEVIDKDRLYHQLLEKVSKNDIQRKGLLNNDKKFSDLLQKSRIQLNQTRKKYDDQLKINNILKQQLQKKDIDVSIVKQKSEQYCKNQQQIFISIKNDYSKMEAQLKSTQNYLSQNKKALKKVALGNEQLEQQIQKLNKQNIELSEKNQQLKKQTLKTGMDQKQISYVNNLKQQNTQLKRQLQKVSEQVIAVNQQKLRLKSQIRHGKDSQMPSLELSKKISQVKYLQKIIDDSINVLGIKDYKKSVGQSLKFGIMELQRQLAKSKLELTQLTDQITIKNQKLQILETQKYKTSTSKEQQDTLVKIRNKINKASTTFESFRQFKQQDKFILQMKDTNKSNPWGVNSNRS